jgi:hypothetical protein
MLYITATLVIALAIQVYNNMPIQVTFVSPVALTAGHVQGAQTIALDAIPVKTESTLGVGLVYVIQLVVSMTMEAALFVPCVPILAKPAVGAAQRIA